jgi:hypothetical protein
MEAAAAGGVVTLPPYLKKTFGHARLCCELFEVLDLVGSLVADQERFADLPARGRRVVDKRFGPTAYTERLQRVLNVANGAITSSSDQRITPRISCAAVPTYWTTSFRDLRSKRSIKRRTKRFKRTWPR